MFSLVIPTYNEKGNIKPLLDAVSKTLDGLDYEVIVVDDDSPDGTAAEVLNYRVQNKRVRLIVRRKDKGLSSAVVAGFERARGEVLGVMDADLSHDHRVLPEMIDQVVEGFDMCIGSRAGVEGWGFKRKLISRSAALLARTLLGVSISDPMSGFFVVKREVFERVRDELNPLGYKIMLEVFYRARPLKVSEVFYVFNDRVHGESKLSNKVVKDYLKQLMSLRKV